MSLEFNLISSDEYCTYITDGTHGTHSNQEYGKYLLSAKDILDGNVHIKDNSRIISEDDFNKIHKNYKLENYDVLLTVAGTIGRTAIIKNYENNYTFQRSVAIFKTNDKIKSLWLYYYLNSPIGKQIIKSLSKGTTQLILPLKDLRSLEIPVPKNIVDQKKILSVLTNIDKKIEINKKINKNLADCILAIYRRWFVDFEPFKNESFIDSDFGFIPENWKVGSIGDYCKLKSGFAFKSAWWQDEGIKVIKIKDINQDNIDLSDCSCVSSDKLEKASEFKVIGGDLLIAMTGATIGKFSIVPKNDQPLYVNQRVGKFFLGDKPSSKLPFIWSLLKQKRIFDEIINRGQGSAQPNVSPTDIETIEIILPPIEIINQFNEECQSMFELMINNSYEITKLNKLRDTLLPKLMSGEIDVSQINCDLE